MHSELDQLYCRMLSLGFILLRKANDAGDAEWVASELELLHNVPSLVGEENALRHEYFWLQERTAYIERASASGRERQKSEMLTYYDPIWRKMEPLISAMCGQ